MSCHVTHVPPKLTPTSPWIAFFHLFGVISPPQAAAVPFPCCVVLDTGHGHLLRGGQCCWEAPFESVIFRAVAARKQHARGDSARRRAGSRPIVLPPEVPGKDRHVRQRHTPRVLRTRLPAVLRPRRLGDGRPVPRHALSPRPLRVAAVPNHQNHLQGTRLHDARHQGGVPTHAHGLPEGVWTRRRRLVRREGPRRVARAHRDGRLPPGKRGGGRQVLVLRRGTRACGSGRPSPRA